MKWTSEELELVKQHYSSQGVDFFEGKLNRTKSSITQKAFQLKLPSKSYKVWTDENVKFLIDNYPEYGAKYCAQKLNLTIEAVRIKACLLNVKHDIFWNIKLGFNICFHCGQKKPLSEFRKNVYKPTGYTTTCRDCGKIKGKEIRSKDDFLEKRRVRDNKRYKQDNHYKLSMIYRSRMRDALKANRKCGRSLELLGCSIAELKQHIEKQFLPGMTWENYGGNDYAVAHWHIDHIKPCASFNLMDPEEQRKCFNYLNLQPLWATTKMAKDNGCEGVMGNLEKKDTV